MKMYYVANVRIPTKKAYGIQMAKMCEAFIEAGVDLELVIPSTHAARNARMHEFYRLRVDIPTVTLPALDWYDRGRIGYIMSAGTFSFSCVVFFLWRRITGRSGVFYSIPDALSLAAGVATGLSCFVECHDMALPRTLFRLFYFVRGVFPINERIRDALVAKKIIKKEATFVAHNGVDVELFTRAPSREEARAQLALPPDKKVALYTGRFYDWKGLDILPAAAGHTPDVSFWVVGGTREEFEQVTGITDIPPNMHVFGECKSYEVPVWLAAADALIIMGTNKFPSSYEYLSPMKSYEYMAARRPVIASAAPALRTIIPEDSAVFYEPDNAEDLARKVTEVVLGGPVVERIVDRAYVVADAHSWEKRAAGIKAFIEGRLPDASVKR